MATAEEEVRGAALIYGLFYKYATRVPGETVYGVQGISYRRMKELMAELDLLEGVPLPFVDVFVREHLQRADQEGTGIICAQDFVVWLLTEVAALVPVRDAYCRATGLRPLYNQFHAVLLGDVGFSDGARRPALGMLAWQFLRLAEEYGLSSSQENARHAFKAARASIGAFRASSGGNTGAPSAEPSGGGRLQFAAFVRALAILASQKMSSLDATLYQVVSCGAPPPSTDPRVGKAPLPAAATTQGLYSQLEGGCTKESYQCGNCGQQHSRWRLDNWLKLEELLLSLGIPQPVRHYMPGLPLINARNLRVLFHRYNAMYNKGRLPPSSYRLPTHSAAQRGEEEGVEPSGGGGGGCGTQPAAYGACCCLYRSLSVMEMSSWLRLCGDCDAIRELIATHGSGVTMSALEAAFVQASSVAGVYCPDDSSGIHDVPIPHGDGGSKLALQRNRLGSVVGSDSRAASEHPPKRSNAAYQSPHDGHPLAVPDGGGGGGGAPRLHQVQGPASASAWLASAKSLPYGSGGGCGAAAAAGKGQQHRPSRLALTFPQFLEALRLVAEEAGGHPTRTALAERALLRIVHDLVRECCPRADPTTVAGTAQIRRQLLSADGSGRHREDEEAGGARVDKVQGSGRGGGGGGSSSSATTSTKYSYDDFTPPESNLYTSATSSRIGSRPAPAGAGGAGGSGRRLGTADSFGGTSATTSTKYSYDDFTPPESNLYTSAASSRIGSRPSSASQPWRPQPVRSAVNMYSSSLVGNAAAKSLPSQLQPKQRAAAGMPPPPSASPAVPSAWIKTMPSAPTARNNPVSASVSASAAGTSSGVSPPFAPRTRPTSAPRTGPRSAYPGEDDDDYDGCLIASATAAAAAWGHSNDDDDAGAFAPRARPNSAPRTRPASAHIGGMPGFTSNFASGSGGGGGGAAAATAVRPPFAPRSRPTSAARVRPSVAGHGDAADDAGDYRRKPDGRGPSRPPPTPTPWPVKHAWEQPSGGWSGSPQMEQARPSSAQRGRSASTAAVAGGMLSAAAAAAGGRLSAAAAAADRQAGAARGGGGSGSGSGGSGTKPATARPLSRTSSSPSPAGVTRLNLQALTAPQRPQPGATKTTTIANKPNRSAAGTGFVSPLYPEPYIPGAAAAASSGRPSSAAGPRQAAVPRQGAADPPPMPYTSPAEQVAAAASVHATAAAAPGEAGQGRPILQGGSGLRNIMLLLATDPYGSDPAGTGSADAVGVSGRQSAEPADRGVGGRGVPPLPLPLPPQQQQPSARELSNRWGSGGATSTAGRDSSGAAASGLRRTSGDSHPGWQGNRRSSAELIAAADADLYGAASAASAARRRTSNSSAERPPLPPPHFATMPDQPTEQAPLEHVVVMTYPAEDAAAPSLSARASSSGAGGRGSAARYPSDGEAPSSGGGLHGDAENEDEHEEHEAEEDEGPWCGVPRMGSPPAARSDGGDDGDGDGDGSAYGAAAPSPRAVLAAAAAKSAGAGSARGGRPPAEGTVNGVQQYFFS